MAVWKRTLHVQSVQALTRSSIMPRLNRSCYHHADLTRSKWHVLSGFTFLDVKRLILLIGMIVQPSNFTNKENSVWFAGV